MAAEPDRSAPAGAPEGFEAFFRAEYPVVARIAYGVLHDAHLAEDVAQDVLIAARQRFSDPDRSEHAAAWVRIAAAHLGLNELRARRRREERQRREPSPTSPAGPEDLALERERSAEVRDALRRLPRRMATVLVLRHSGLSYGEVAEAIGVHVGQVGTMLRRAEARFRKELDGATRR